MNDINVSNNGLYSSCHCEEAMSFCRRSNRLNTQPVIASDQRERSNRLYGFYPSCLVFCLLFVFLGVVSKEVFLPLRIKKRGFALVLIRVVSKGVLLPLRIKKRGFALVLIRVVSNGVFSPLRIKSLQGGRR